VSLVEAFHRLDTDKNGYLDAHETMELVRDLYKSTGGDPANFNKASCQRVAKTIMEKYSAAYNKSQGNLAQMTFDEFQKMAQESENLLGIRDFLIRQKVFSHYCKGAEVEGPEQYTITESRFIQMVRDALAKQHPNDPKAIGKASELAETIWRRSSAYIGGHGRMSFAEFTLWISPQSAVKEGLDIFNILADACSRNARGAPVKFMEGRYFCSTHGPLTWINAQHIGTVGTCSPAVGQCAECVAMS
jgi:hypothetical protein